MGTSRDLELAKLAADQRRSQAEVDRGEAPSYGSGSLDPAILAQLIQTAAAMNEGGGREKHVSIAAKRKNELGTEFAPSLFTTGGYLSKPPKGYGELGSALTNFTDGLRANREREEVLARKKKLDTLIDALMAKSQTAKASQPMPDAPAKGQAPEASSGGGIWDSFFGKKGQQDPLEGFPFKGFEDPGSTNPNYNNPSPMDEDEQLIAMLFQGLV